MRQVTLRPHDIAVALELALRPGEPFTPLAKAVGLSLSEAHAAVGRLTRASLLRQDERRVAPSALLDFLVTGAPHAFPAMLGPETRGVLTAAAAPPLASEFPNAERHVWPSAAGTARGPSLTPLYPKAVHLAGAQPDLYALVTLVDALRVGRARERTRAAELLAQHLRGETAP